MLCIAEYEDMPPLITRIIVNGVFVIGGYTSDPADFVQVLNNSYLHGTPNDITCEATNAQIIKFQFSSTGADTDWDDTLPDILYIHPVRRIGKEAIHVVDDGTISQISELTKWNGYYRCFTETTFDRKTYVSASPAIMIILPCK